MEHHYQKFVICLNHLISSLHACLFCICLSSFYSISLVSICRCSELIYIQVQEAMMISTS
ncbi:hypothetical protein HanOQP8_Chr06g0222601 [Helianthus annuus]|nr:hypothetical protein HanOQP8_Chr06g0222601 [Helianthus annuus]